MSHPYDASTKYLLQHRLADWLPGRYEHPVPPREKDRPAG